LKIQKAKLSGASKRTHGHTRQGKQSVKTPEYQAWRGIKTRCFNKKSAAYAHYGGRGIAVSTEWAKSFETFLQDMGRRPSAKHTIERKNNDGPYSKGNCLWALRTEQMRNRRLMSTNKSGVDGVTFYKPTNKWVAHITRNKKRHFLGYYQSLQDAIKARLFAQRDLDQASL
jgi:hypothetical protein